MEVYSETDLYIIRKLGPEDFNKGYRDLLSDLTQPGSLDESLFRSVYEKMQSSQVAYTTIVIEEKSSGILIGNGTLVAVADVYNNGKISGLIEDIVVLKRVQGQGYGYKIIQTLKDIASSKGYNKVELDCSESNEKFYNKCGLFTTSAHMGLYF